MKRPRPRLFHFAGVVVALGIAFVGLAGDGAWSQATRTIKIVVPFPPGGGVDIVARLMADQIGRAHSTTVVIDNRPGAGTMIATEAVARAAPDGNTILFVANSFVINANLRKVAYDPLTSFEPICLLTRSPNVVAVNGASPYRSLTDLVSDARAKPGTSDDGVSGACHQSAHRRREAQARDEHRDGQCPIPRLRAGRQRPPGRTRERPFRQLPGRG